MDAKQYLQQIRMIDLKIEMLEDERLRLGVLATKVTSNLDKISVQSTQGNTHEDAMIRYADAGRELDSMIKEAISKRIEILSQLIKIQEPVSIGILYKRYFEIKSWSSICEETNISVDNIYKAHKKAIDSFEKIINS